MDEPTRSAEDPSPVHERVIERVRVAEPPRRTHRFFWGLVSGCLLLFVLFTLAGATLAFMGRDSASTGSFWSLGDKIAIVPIDGVIYDSRNAVEALQRYGEDDSIRAIVVRVNSPGGAIVPSQEIFEAIRRIRRESGKPVVASLDSVAASGGYYVAVGCQRIVANPGSITGSIGVISEWFNVEELLRWAKLKPETITSGAMKAAGSPYRQTTPEERQYLQGIVTELHGQFVDAVTQGREGKLNRTEVARLADGRVFTGAQAHRLKLVDDLGTLEDAIDIAAKLAKIEGDVETVYPREETPGLLDMLASSKAVDAVIERVEAQRSRQFQYRW